MEERALVLLPTCQETDDLSRRIRTLSKQSCICPQKGERGRAGKRGRQRERERESDSERMGRGREKRERVKGGEGVRNRVRGRQRGRAEERATERGRGGQV